MCKETLRNPAQDIAEATTFMAWIAEQTAILSERLRCKKLKPGARPQKYFGGSNHVTREFLEQLQSTPWEPIEAICLHYHSSFGF